MEPPLKKTKHEETFGKPLEESDVGITEYISSHIGFSVVIKQRFSDFLVNEISTDKKIVHLDQVTLNEDFSTQKSQEEETVDLLPITNDAKSELKTIISQKAGELVIKAACIGDKTVRTTIHKQLRNICFNLISSTVNIGEEKAIKVLYQKNGDKRNSHWNKQDKYCKFVLYKENKDTMEAIDFISKKLRLKTGLFSYAGTKDKRAKTCQHVCAFKIDARRLMSLNKFTEPKIVLGNFSYCSEPLNLGKLYGNHFTVILRNVTGENEEIEKAVNSLKVTGFINYYGMQRFGTTTVPTHVIGRCLIQLNWKAAIDFILKPRDGDSVKMEACRKEWIDSQDPVKCLQLLDKKCCVENYILTALSKCSTDYLGALNKIPRNMRLMYLHSFQSYLWNVVTSMRIQKFGLKVVIGDLVIKKSDDNLEKSFSPLLVSESNINDYSLTDVVIPLLGYDVKYPENGVHNWYTDLLQTDNLKETDFKHKIKDYSLRGDYRHIIVKPENVLFEILRYNDPSVSLLLSDYEKLKQHDVITSTSDGKYKAVNLEFSLPTSSYATMAIREISKTDTSASYHSTLNNY